MKKIAAHLVLLLAVTFAGHAEGQTVEDAEYGYDGALIVRGGATSFHQLAAADRWLEAGGYLQYRFATNSFAAVPHASIGLGNAFAGVSRVMFDRQTPDTPTYDFGFVYQDLKFKASTEDFEQFTYFIGINIAGRAAARQP